MNLDIISNTLHFVSGAAIIGFGLVLLFVSNKVRGITRFKIAKNLLALYMLVVGASFYIAYAVGKYEVADKIEALNFISLLIYFIATSLMIGAFIFMFDLKGFLDVKKMIVRVMIPTSLVVLYSLVAILFGDYKVYSLIELYEQIPAHPILLLRLFVFAAVIDFFLYCI